MQELTFEQVEVVSGGNSYGTGKGGIFSINNISAAGRFAGGLGFIAGAFQVGYAAGGWLNNNTPIQAWISEAIS